MSKEDLVAERFAIESYSEVIRWLGINHAQVDRGHPQDRRGTHAKDLKTLLAKIKQGLAARTHPATFCMRGKSHGSYLQTREVHGDRARVPGH
jgi:hypothetical protein